MKILQVSELDLVGNRFNGYDLNKYFIEKGNQSQQCVWWKQSTDDNVWQLFDVKSRDSIRNFFVRAEQNLSVQSLLYPFPLQLLFDKRFRTVDVVHYHLIHANFFSIACLPLLSRMKPTVWTLHDPWAMTGHCVHPYDCARWEYGCGSCPYLETFFAMKKDRTRLMWTIKKLSYRASKMDIIVASKFMYNMAKRSPLLTKSDIHHIPFGLDLEVFRPADGEYAKKKLGIIPGSLVICFRSTNFEFKGLRYIKECLHKLQTDKPICLLTFNEAGQIEELRGKYQLVEMGWVGDNRVLAEVYNAADIFLMPSTQEAFGMTAMEAMACGKPVIVFDGTALPETVFAPEGGIAVPQGDVDALLFELEQLIENPEKRLQLGRNALELARRNYNFNDHADKVLELYREVIARRGKSCS